MEVAMEVEDDVFFADLSKQINLLIMDDDEDLVTHSPSVSLQDFSQAIEFQPAPQFPYLHEQSYKREIKGTGVFIPRSSHQRRSKNRQGRNSSSNAAKFQNSKGLLPQVPHNNNNNIAASYNDSSNSRRF